MKTVIILFLLFLIAFIIKELLNINILLLMVKKDKQLLNKENELEKKYQFIKGLY